MELGGWTEQLHQRSFDRTLSEKPDLQLLINHEGMPLARTKSGTLELKTDRIGLKVRALLDPRDPDVQALLPKMERGDMDEMSFAFRVKDQEWNDDYTHRMIREVSLQKGDVSVVNYGMNPTTKASIMVPSAVEALGHANDREMAELRKLPTEALNSAMRAIARARGVDPSILIDNFGGRKDEDVAFSSPITFSGVALRGKEASIELSNGQTIVCSPALAASVSAEIAADAPDLRGRGTGTQLPPGVMSLAQIRALNGGPEVQTELDKRQNALDAITRAKDDEDADEADTTDENCRCGRCATCSARAASDHPESCDCPACVERNEAKAADAEKPEGDPEEDDPKERGDNPFAAADEDEDPDDEDDKPKKRGSIPYADPGHIDGVKRCRVDTEANAREAWTYINANASAYTARQYSDVKATVRRALARFGVSTEGDEQLSTDIDHVELRGDDLAPVFVMKDGSEMAVSEATWDAWSAMRNADELADAYRGKPPVKDEDDEEKSVGKGTDEPEDGSDPTNDDEDERVEPDKDDEDDEVPGEENEPDAKAKPSKKRKADEDDKPEGDHPESDDENIDGHDDKDKDPKAKERSADEDDEEDGRKRNFSISGAMRNLNDVVETLSLRDAMQGLDALPDYRDEHPEDCECEDCEAKREADKEPEPEPEPRVLLSAAFAELRDGEDVYDVTSAADATNDELETPELVQRLLTPPEPEPEPVEDEPEPVNVRSALDEFMAEDRQRYSLDEAIKRHAEFSDPDPNAPTTTVIENGWDVMDAAEKPFLKKG